jgi:hypothetical protein
LTRTKPSWTGLPAASACQIVIERVAVAERQLMRRCPGRRLPKKRYALLIAYFANVVKKKKPRDGAGLFR